MPHAQISQPVLGVVKIPLEKSLQGIPYALVGQTTTMQHPYLANTSKVKISNNIKDFLGMENLVWVIVIIKAFCIKVA